MIRLSTISQIARSIAFGLLLSFPLLSEAQYTDRPSVLIELFSSEGCSSCPYADKFAKEILNIADSTGSLVYVLDYHVDIWNRSGWVDPYSDTAYTKRQALYMEKVGQKALFTPMMFINGQHGLPASDKRNVGAAIYNALATYPRVAMLLNANMLGNDSGLTITYDIQTKLDSLQLNLALAEKEVTNQVTAGENAGQTLTHHQVVRQLHTIKLDKKSGQYQLHLPAGTDLSKYTLVGFVQKINTWEVLVSDELYFRR